MQRQLDRYTFEKEAGQATLVACSDIQMAALKQARAARAIAEDPELSDGIPMEDSLAPVPAHASKKQSEIGATLVVITRPRRTSVLRLPMTPVPSAGR